MAKKRIMFVGEASFLNTGFSTIYRELLPRLAKTGKYSLAELASYSRQDNHLVYEFVQNRWKFYGVQPMTEEENRAFHDPKNQSPRCGGQNTWQFGEGKFPEACADFRPDLVVSLRDNWMDEFTRRSEFRSFFRWIWQPTVDACFVAGTHIVTIDGVKNIEDIKVGDVVLTHNGSYKNVTKVFKNICDTKLIRITSTNNALPVVMTEDHPVLVVSRKKQKWTNTSRRHRSVNHKYRDGKFVSASQVKVGDYVVAPKIQSECDVDIVDLSFYCNHNKHYQVTDKHIFVRSTSQKLNRFIQLNSDVLKMFGLFLAEGGISKKDYNITFSMNGETEQHHLNFIKRSLKKYFNVNAKRIDKKDNKCSFMNFSSATCANIFTNLFGKDCYTRKIPDFIMSLPKYKLLPLIEGMIIGDGSDTNSSHGKRVISYATSSRCLAIQLFNILLKCGYLCSLSQQKTGNYAIQLLGKNCARLVEDLNWCDTDYEFGRLNTAKSWIDEDSGHALMRVKNVEKLNKKVKYVYNFEVEDDHSYVTSFAVHNCPQKEEWVDDYRTVDLVTSYSDFGIHVLKQHGGMKVYPTPLRPGVDLNVFRPMDRASLKKKWLQCEDDVKIVTFISRNQSRKLFPDAIDAFAIMKERYKGTQVVDKSVLLLHTSWPDNVYSYDYPRHVMRMHTGYYGLQYYNRGIKNDVLQTMLCHECGHVFIGWAASLHGKQIENRGRGPKIYLTCDRCGKQSAATPDTATGYTREQLAEIMSMTDIAVQVSVAEGCAMPVQEFKSCGTPVCVVDYSATAEKGRFPSEYIHLKDVKPEEYTVNKGGIAIPADRFYYEPETSCKRALPDVSVLADELYKLLIDDERREKLGIEARECAEENYNWDKLAKEWEYVLDNVKPLDRSETWDKSYEIRDVKKAESCPSHYTDEQFITYLYLEVLGYPKVDDQGMQQWLTALQNGQSRDQIRSVFENIANQEVHKENKIHGLLNQYSSKDSYGELV